MRSNNTNEVKGEVTVTFVYASANIFDHQKKAEVMKNFGRLPMDDIESIEKIMANSKSLEAMKQFSRLSADDAERVSQIMASPKALNALKQFWGMLKAKFS